MAEATPTALLKLWRSGDPDALDRLMPLVYDELSRIAHGAMSAERRDHTLQTRALVHEAYLRLIDANIEFQDRAHFLALSARTMRRILTDHAKARHRVKRGQDPLRVELTDVRTPAAADGLRHHAVDAVDLDQALTDLARQDARKGQLIELLFYGGLTYEEAAAALGLSRASVGREAQLAKAWLARALGVTRVSTDQDA